MTLGETPWLNILFEDGLPSIDTSQQLLSRLLHVAMERDNIDVQACAVELLSFTTVDPCETISGFVDLTSDDDRPMSHIRIVNVEAQGVISFVKVKRRKKQVGALPFGLKERPKQRRPRPKKPTVTRQVHFPVGVVGGAPVKTPVSAAHQFHDSDSEASEDTSEDSSEDQPELPTAPPVGEDNFPAEGEVIAMAPEVVEEETRAKVVADELAQATAEREAVADAYHGVGTSSTFFARVTGVSHCAKAASGRSSCFFCHEPIPKDSIRLCYWHDRKQPSRWIHPTCCHRLRPEERGNSIRALTTILNNPDCDPDIATAIRTALSNVGSAA